jgi:lycopene cyclase domain-containing protein
MSYLLLAMVFLVPPLALTAILVRVARPSGEWWLATLAVLAVLLVLTALFDSVMVAADLFRYDEEALSGARVLLTPVEDLAWPLASALALPALWGLLGRRHDTTRSTS